MRCFGIVCLAIETSQTWSHRFDYLPSWSLLTSWGTPGLAHDQWSNMMWSMLCHLKECSHCSPTFYICLGHISNRPHRVEDNPRNLPPLQLEAWQCLPPSAAKCFSQWQHVVTQTCFVFPWLCLGQAALSHSSTAVHSHMPACREAMVRASGEGR